MKSHINGEKRNKNQSGNKWNTLNRKRSIKLRAVFLKRLDKPFRCTKKMRRLKENQNQSHDTWYHDHRKYKWSEETINNYILNNGTTGQEETDKFLETYNRLWVRKLNQ